MTYIYLYICTVYIGRNIFLHTLIFSIQFVLNLAYTPNDNRVKCKPIVSHHNIHNVCRTQKHDFELFIDPFNRDIYYTTRYIQFYQMQSTRIVIVCIYMDICSTLYTCEEGIRGKSSELDDEEKEKFSFFLLLYSIALFLHVCGDLLTSLEIRSRWSV